jgi:drug/metabolite transporter (DMT)-like permease
VEQSRAHRLPAKVILWICALCVMWGVNSVAIKISNRGLAPLTAAAVRSVIASLLVMGWVAACRLRLFHKGPVLWWGALAGVFFALEFLLLYAGLALTGASRAVVLLYSAPFFIATGAHFTLAGDRLNRFKILGLVLAFVGVASVMGQHRITFEVTAFRGDLLALGAAVAWAGSTLIVKRHLAAVMEPVQSLHYQLVFSIGLLVPAALILEPDPVRDFDLSTLLSLFYQSVLVAVISYLAWFILIHRYSASRVSSVTFVAPVAGVLAGGVILGEALPATLWLGLSAIAVGIYLVNR